jgi:hypothetical protein
MIDYPPAPPFVVSTMTMAFWRGVGILIDALK